MSQQQEHTNDIKTLAKKLKGIRIAMLTTEAADGSLRSRPMGTQDEDFDGTLWFFTYANSGKVDDIKADQHVNVSYSKPDDNLYISVSGKANIVHDRKKMEALWAPILKTWFPRGLEDPNIALLQVAVQQAEYWESNLNSVQILAGFVKASITGQAADVGKDVKLNFETHSREQ
ncbi:MAG: pyridoxamine 5'-phosphate oxidase family protein [Herpetosiphon sp.]